MNERLFKVLGENGECINGGTAKWSLPTKQVDGTWTPGDWMPAATGELKLCVNGYHLCRQQDLIHWIGPTIYEAEYQGERIDGDDKIAVREARLLRKYEAWNEHTARLFACWCVRQVWHLLKDERSRKAVEVAEAFAVGKATEKELAAAGAAAWDAAWAAAGDAAGDAAWTAAGAAAWDAAWAAAGAAARAAAGTAARAAARTAAGTAAGTAAWTAAWDAAGAAAWDAAGDAAGDAQTQHLLVILDGEAQA